MKGFQEVEFVDLLTSAAKAANYDIKWNSDKTHAFKSGKDDPWNPLANQDDALTLAIDLQIDIKHLSDFNGDIIAVASGFGKEDYQSTCFPRKDCPYQATRNAITWAAYLIGQRKEA